MTPQPAPHHQCTSTSKSSAINFIELELDDLTRTLINVSHITAIEEGPKAKIHTLSRYYIVTAPYSSIVKTLYDAGCINKAFTIQPSPEMS